MGGMAQARVWFWNTIRSNQYPFFRLHMIIKHISDASLTYLFTGLACIVQIRLVLLGHVCGPKSSSNLFDAHFVITHSHVGFGLWFDPTRLIDGHRCWIGHPLPFSGWSGRASTMEYKWFMCHHLIPSKRSKKQRKSLLRCSWLWSESCISMRMSWTPPLPVTKKMLRSDGRLLRLTYYVSPKAKTIITWLQYQPLESSKQHIWSYCWPMR